MSSTEKRRLRLSEADRRQVFAKTDGHCHFCGDRLVFEKRGRWHQRGTGAWEADHVVQLGRDGVDTIGNYLPACTECNQLRWFHDGPSLRLIIRTGLVGKREMDRKTALGNALADAVATQELKNDSRRTLQKPEDDDDSAV